MSPRTLLVASVSVFVVAACHAEGGNLNASFVAAGSGAESRSENQSSTTTTGPSQADAPPATSAAPPAPTAPPTDACPLVCYEARGPVSAPLTVEETAQLRTALEPLMSRLRTCAGSDGFRRHLTPFVQLRIAPDGTLAEHGVDPVHDFQTSCFQDASRSTSLSVSLPTPKAVRCAERCVVDNGGRRGRGRR